MLQTPGVVHDLQDLSPITGTFRHAIRTAISGVYPPKPVEHMLVEELTNPLRMLQRVPFNRQFTTAAVMPA